jgi:small ubiquitin-related modifier
MGKVFQTYASKKGVQVDTIRFTYDGERVDKDSTPKMLGLEDQDQIDCFRHHVGGVRDLVGPRHIRPYSTMYSL